MMPMMGSNDVGGSSTVNMLHWSQIAKSGKLETRKTKDQEPVPYDVDQLAKSLKDTKVALFAGEFDALVHPKDFKLLQDALKGVDVTTFKVGDYNHLDYMWASDVSEKVNKDMLDFIHSL